MIVKIGKIAKVLLVGGLIMVAQLVAPLANAQEATNLGTFKFWTAWKGTDADGVVCYISSQPQDAQPTNVNRDPIHFLVVHRKGRGTWNEAQTLVGYPLKEGSTPSVVVDGKSYSMIIEGSAAFLASIDDDAPFVDAMKRGSELVVKGLSQRGTNTTDTYSLGGVTLAMKEIDKACGYSP